MIVLANAPTPKPKPRELEQQKTDFTAEGAPPPGKAPAGEPATSSTQEPAKVAGSGTGTASVAGQDVDNPGA